MQQEKKRIEICGIKRATKYSPNHIDNDEAIFLAAAKELENLGCAVTVYSENQFLAEEINTPYIFGMMRDTPVLNKLLQLEELGSIVLNSARGITNCIRKRLTEILVSHGVPHPESYIIDTNTAFTHCNFPYWIKRGDAHAILKKDVCYVTNEKEIEDVLNDFEERGIKQAVVSEHLQGDLVKFYGVEGTAFFHWFYPSPCTHSKFGLEEINGEAKGYAFDVKELQKISNQAAKELNVPIYGGDAVVLPTGEVKLIDFNDWPSFARCREEAGYYIAQRIFKQITEKQK